MQSTAQATDLAAPKRGYNSTGREDASIERKSPSTNRRDAPTDRGDASTDASHPDFNPCSNAKITSPFYLYHHDSPRVSGDVKRPPVVVHDLEAEAGVRVGVGVGTGMDTGMSMGTSTLSPSITQEKQDAHRARTSRFHFWKRAKPCMTKPKPRGCTCLSHMPPKQRLLVKILIAVLIIGAMVGIAVGISIRVGGGVYKTNNSMRPIG